MNQLENEVLAFFKKKLSKKITISSVLNDFCKYEDDAFFLFLDFFEKFKIDKGYLDLDKYFYITPFFWNRFRLRKEIKEEKEKGKPKLTIEHLVKVAERREFFDPIE